MSQIHYTADTSEHGRVHVQTGWDRMLHKCHLTVMRDGEEDRAVLEEVDGVHGCATWSHVIATLEKSHIPIHPDLAWELVQHQKCDFGNVIVRLGHVKGEEL